VSALSLVRAGGRRGSRAELREEAILRATLDLLTEIGYDRMSIDGVAARAHSSKSTIYRRWPGKADLVVAAVTRYSGQELEVPADSGSLRTDLVALVAAMRDVLVAYDAGLILGLAMAARHDPDLALTVRMQVMDDKHSACLSVVERAVRRGELPSADGAGMLTEVSSSMLFARLSMAGDAPDDAFVAELVDRVLLPMLKSYPGDDREAAATR
jgi:AcrR family transcriptional regulator